MKFGTVDEYVVSFRCIFLEDSISALRKVGRPSARLEDGGTEDISPSVLRSPFQPSSIRY